MLNRSLDTPFYQRVLDTYSGAQCQSLARTFVKNQTW